MSKLVFFFVLALAARHVQCGMTEAQMKSAIKLLKNVCQPKSKVTPVQLENLRNGVLNQEPEVLSYMECLFRTGQVMKDGQLNYESLRSQVVKLPPQWSEPALITVENCKDSPKSNDKYVAAFEFYKCFYEDNPSNFFFL